MRQAGKRTVPDDLGLADNLPEKIGDSGEKRSQMEVRVWF
jgi:hypothetical protein